MRRDTFVRVQSPKSKVQSPKSSDRSAGIGSAAGPGHRDGTRCFTEKSPEKMAITPARRRLAWTHPQRAGKRKGRGRDTLGLDRRPVTEWPVVRDTLIQLLADPPKTSARPHSLLDETLQSRGTRVVP